MSKNHPAKIEVTTEPTIAEDFDAFRKLDTQSKAFATKASAALILSGAELARLHGVYGVHRGGDQTRTRAGLLWRDLVQEYGGINEDTAMRRIKLAEAASEQLPILREVLAGDVDFRSLPAAKKDALERGLKCLTEGKSQRQLMWDFGLTPEPKLKGGERFDKALIAQFCREFHPDMPAAQCQALPGKLKKQFRKWALSQQPPEDGDAPARLAIDALRMMATKLEAAATCKISVLKDWIEAKDALGRMLRAALEKRKQ